MRVIGITGGTGCGKTSVLRMMERLGCFAIDADEVYHHLLRYSVELREALRQAFPDAVSENGDLDRVRLGQIVYNDEQKMHELTAITHPSIIKQVEHILEVGEKHNASMAVIDAVFLIESGLDERCDLTVGVVAPREVRMHRIMLRDGISEQAALMRIDAQPDEEFYREHCDYILDNSRDDNSIHDRTVGFYDSLVSGLITKKKKN